MLYLFILAFTGKWCLSQETNTDFLQAESYYEAKQYDSSLLVLRQIIRQAQEDPALNINALLLKAKNHNRKREYAERLKSASTALGIAEKQFEGDTLHAIALRAKGDAFIRTQAYDSSIVYLGRAEKLFLQLEDWSQAASCMVGQGVNHYRLRQLIAADSMLTGAMQLMDQRLDKLPSLYGTSSNILGAIFRAQGDHEKALINYQAAVRFHEEHTQNVQRLTYAYNNLGTAYFRRGDYDKAEEFLLLAEIKANQQEPADQEALSDVYNNLMLTYTFKKRYASAEKYGNLSQALYQSGNVEESAANQALFYNNLALLSIETGDYKQAMSLLNQAIDLGGSTAQANANLGYYYYRLGDHNAAKPLLDQAIDQFGDTDPLSLSKVYRYKALGAAEIGNPEEVKALFEASIQAVVPTYQAGVLFKLPAMNQVRSKRELLRTLTAQGSYFQDQNLSQELVKSTLLSAIALSDSMYLAHKAEGSRRFLKNELIPLYENTIAVLSQEFKETGNIETAEMIFSIMERAKSNLLMDLLQVKNSNQLAGVPKDLIELERSLQIDIDFFRAEAYRATAKGDTVKAELYRTYELNKLNEWDQLLGQFESDYTRYYRQRHRVQDHRLDKARMNLTDASSLLVEYFTGPKVTYALAMTQDAVYLSHLGSTDSLRLQVAEFIKSINQPNAILNDMSGAYQQLTERGYALYETLIEPLVNQVKVPINAMTLIPDGFLNLLSFDALLTEKPSTDKVDFTKLPYLIKSQEVSYLLAASLEDSNGISSKEVLAMAPFGNSELPNTQTEVEQIRKHLEGRFYPQVASELDFVSDARSYGILHLATHGVLNEDNPQLSYLAFTPANSQDSLDQKLFAYELENMDLSAQLVVLSACETGSGQIASGEGVMSLARAFSYTGVESLVMSLWQVDDQAGSNLMDTFYQGLVNNLGKPTALRQAKMQYLNQADQLHAHPYFWSQFVLVGNADPLADNSFGSGSNFTVIVIIISVGLVIFLIIALFRFRLNQAKRN